MCLTKLLHSGPEQQESGLLTLLRDGCLCSLSLPLVFCSMMGNLTATSPATLPSLGQKVSFLFFSFFLCLHFSISSTLVVYNVCMCFRREHRRCRFLCVRQSCQRSPCCCFYGNRWQTRGGEESPRTGTSEG